MIQRILRHSTVATTQNHYIKTASPDATAAMKQFSEILLCSACAPDGDIKANGSVQVGFVKYLPMSELAEREGFEPSVQVLARTTV